MAPHAAGVINLGFAFSAGYCGGMFPDLAVDTYCLILISETAMYTLVDYKLLECRKYLCKFIFSFSFLCG